jgi:dCTP diphosphatase
MNEETITQLTKKLIKFRDDRNWQQFHSHKDLVAALAIETSELQEEFLWKSEDDIAQMLKTPSKREAVSDEIADVFAYLLLIAEKTGINLESALLAKIVKNNAKYPANRVKGDARKYTEY